MITVGSILKARVIGGGIAGSEAALQLASAGIQVELIEMRPVRKSPAHKTGLFAELVCSSSFGDCSPLSVQGRLKEELKEQGSFLIREALACGRTAGKVLEVDKRLFAERVSALIGQNKNIKLVNREALDIDSEICQIIAAGPMTSASLCESLAKLFGRENVFLFGRINPLIDKSSIGSETLFDGKRLYCPMSPKELLELHKILASGRALSLQPADETEDFMRKYPPVESLSIDDLCKRLALPKGFSGKACCAARLFPDPALPNTMHLEGFYGRLKAADQLRAIRSVPGLCRARLFSQGLIHRNTYINSPKLLAPTLQAKEFPKLFFAGQITGTDGYAEAVAGGLLAGKNAAHFLKGEELPVPEAETATGSLVRYISFKGHETFQPVRAHEGFSGKKNFPL